MTATFSVESVLAAPADRVWEALRSPATFLYVTRGLLAMPVLTGRTEPWQEGEVIKGWLLLFHVIPFSSHTMEVVEIDDDEMAFSTREHGGILRRWDHSFKVEPQGAHHCRYTDTVVIDAGRLTVPVSALARWFFCYRHRRWRTLARRIR